MLQNIKKYNLTIPQKNIWMVENFYKHTNINVVAGTFAIKYDFDINIAKQVVNKFIELNDATRIRIVIEKEKVFQYIDEYKQLDVKCIDISSLTLKDITNLKQHIIKEKIDIKGRLFELILLDRKDGYGEILLKAHHIVLDAWSVSKLGTDLADLYEKISKKDFDFEKKPSYIEFIKTEEEYKNSDRFNNDNLFWKDYLKNCPETTYLKDKEYSSVNAKRYHQKIDKNLSIEINEFCKKNTLSVYSVFLSAIAIYMHRITQSNDFNIGTPILNRTNFMQKQMQGMFVNTIPVRFNIDENDNFLETVKKTTLNSMQVFKHQKYSYENMVKETRKANTKKKDLFSIAFSYQNARANINLNRYEIKWIFSETIQEQLEIHILDLNDSGNLEFNIDYLTELFEEQEIKYLAKRIITIIQEGINKNINISKIEIMSKQEQNRIIKEFNNTKKDYPKDKTILDFFEEQVQKNPNKIALKLYDKKLSYKQLDKKANILAEVLKQEDVKQGDRVSIFIDKSFELIISILAIFKIGACYVPIDYNYNLERKKYIIKESNIKLCLCDKEQNIDFEQINVKSIDYEKTVTPLKRPNINSETPVCILYTSGTTGTPKGVEIVNRNVIKLVKNIDYMDFSKEDKILQIASTVFDLSIFEFWASLLNGNTLCLIKKEDLLNFKYLKKYIDENKITIMCITSVLFNQMVAENISIFQNLKQILIGGDKLSIGHIKEVKKKYKNIKIYNSYGPTETTSFCNMYEIKNLNLRNIPIGKPVSNSVGYVLDDKNRLLPLGIQGEYAIGGEGVSNGYINDKNLLNQKFIKNIFTNEFTSKKLYKTGDIVKMNIDGNIEFIGRKDNQVKIKGYRIELEEIKRVALNFNGIKDCAIVIKENKKNISDKRILLYFVSDIELSTNEVLKYLRKNLQSYMIPSDIMQISSIPMNTNYKLDVSKLPEIRKSKVEIKEPLTTKVQKQLSKIIYDILGTKVELNKNLFTLGLDSLNAITLAINISEKFSIDISMKDVMGNNTIKELEILIENNKNILKEDTKAFEQMITSGEKSVFLEWLKNPKTTLYNALFELKFSKKIDVNKLKIAIQETIENNPNMYSEFSINGDEITKTIERNLKYEIGIRNVNKAKYKDICKNFVKPFDLTKAPLFKAEIYVVEEEVHALFDIHHIIFDGSSFAIFIEEIANRYNEKKIADKNENRCYEINEGKLEKAKNYFLDMFKGELPINDLPYDRPRPLTRSFKGNNLILNINKKDSEKIYKYLKNNAVTLNSLCQAAYSILMSKYTYSDDIIMGVAVSGRSNINEKEIAMNVKTVPYRTIIDWDKDIIQYIKNTQLEMINVIDNSNVYAYDNLVKDLELKRDNSRNLLFDVMFVCQNIHLPTLKFGNLNMEFSGFNRTNSKFDLTFEIIPQKDKIEINVEYATDLFNKNTIKSLQKHYINIIKSMISNKNIYLSNIEMILPKEKIEIIKNFNNNKTNYPKKTVHQIFEEQVEKHPNKKAIIFENESLTYRQLNEKANMIARYLQVNGLNYGDVVAIMIDKSLEYLPVAIAILKCGAAYTPIIRDLPDERAKYMIENAKSKFIITNQKFYRKISNTKTIFIDDENLYNKNSKKNLNLKTNIDDMFHIIYTSGSTGLPKGNMIKHRGIIRLLLNTNYIEYTQKDVMLASASLTFDISGFELWGAILYGMTLHIITKEQSLDINYYSNYIKANKITTTFLATPIFHLLVEEDVDMFKDMKSIYIGGEILLPKYTNILFERYKNVRLYNAYGPAEITVICCAQLIDREYKTYEDIPLGKIASNNTVLVLDKCEKICPINVLGELYVLGDGLGKGYINRKDLTKEKFLHIKEFESLAYRSGDLTKWNKNGEIRFFGRIDTQIKIRGQRIELSEIQSKILELPEIKEVVLILKTVDEKNKYIIGYYSQNKKIKEDYIKEYLKKYLPSYMIPYRLILVDKIPYNQNGKIDRNQLPEIEINEDIKIINPKNKEQEKILNIFKDTLQVDDIGINSDFFENGGDSLEVSKLVANLQCHNIKITYADVFKYKTPIEIYNYLYLQKKKNDNILDIDKLDYTQINTLLNKNIYNKNIKMETVSNAQNVLLTGVTGFLGVHILRELVENEKIKKIYCLVRAKDNLDTETRFKKQLKFFFKNEVVDRILKKSEVLKGDITNENLIDKEFNKKIDIVINSAAHVKHYGEYEEFYKINVLGTENIINYCLKENAQLIQMSTMSVSGNILEQGQIIQQNIRNNTVFDETKLYINQNLENVYINTKYIAELKILQSIINNGLKAKIIRLGNLTGRFEDGKFQPNVEDNAFANRIKSLIALKAISDEMYKKYIEMTPIDIVSKAINKILLLKNNDFTVFHLYNDKHVDMPFVLKIIEKMGVKISVKNNKDIARIIKQYMEDKNKLESIKGIIPDIDKNGELKYNDTTIIKSEFTKKVLKELGFKWVDISEKYLIKYLEYLNKIKFIDLEGE